MPARMFVASLFAAAALAAPAHAATDLQWPTRCTTFVQGAQQNLALCQDGMQLMLPADAELAAGQTVRIGMRSRSPALPTLEFAFSAARSGPIPDWFEFTLKSFNGQPASGQCMLGRMQANRGAASIACMARTGGLDTQLNVSHGLGDEKRVDELIAAAAAATRLLQARAGAGPAQGSRPAAPAAPAGAEAAALSEDRRAIFGLLVGRKLAAQAPVCRESLTSNEPVMPKQAPYCISKLGTGLSMLAGEIAGVSAEEYKSVGLQPISLQVNDAIFDTRLASDVLVTIDAERVIQQILITTWNAQHDGVMQMMSEKFGAASSQDETTWTNNQTGQVVGRTPNFYWARGDILASYTSRKAAALDASSTPLGEVIVYSPRYQQLLDQIDARRNTPAPNRRRM